MQGDPPQPSLLREGVYSLCSSASSQVKWQIILFVFVSSCSVNKKRSPNLRILKDILIFAAEYFAKKAIMLNVEDCKKKLSEFKEEHQRELGIKSIGIFGSVARGDNDADSDIDVFVELERPAFSTMFTIHQMLEELFGCKVDLVRKRETLRPLFKRNLERDAIYA